jgi:hypothetical protein
MKTTSFLCIPLIVLPGVIGLSACGGSDSTTALPLPAGAGTQAGLTACTPDRYTLTYLFRARLSETNRKS